MSNFDNSIKISFQGLTEVQAKLRQLPNTLQEVLKEHKTLQEIGTQLAASAKTTINLGGRPVAYKPLAPSTIAAKLRKYKKATRILVAGGTLRESLDYEVQGGQLYLTSVDYLKYHQFTTNRKKANFPARPIWGVQETDKPEITAIILAGVKRNL